MKKTLPASMRWNSRTAEIELTGCHDNTFVPLYANRLWAMLPVNCNDFCHVVDLPVFMRLVDRIGFFLQTGSECAPLYQRLRKRRIFYGANYLRLAGRIGDFAAEVRFYPDADQARLFFEVTLENQAGAEREAVLWLTVDFCLHPMPWGLKGFGCDMSNDYSGNGRKFMFPHDDSLTISEGGRFCAVRDPRGAGTGFLVLNQAGQWDTDRSGSSFEAPHIANWGYSNVIRTEFNCAGASPDSFLLHRLPAQTAPGETHRWVGLFGFQATPDAAGAFRELADHQAAFAATRATYRRVWDEGLDLTTPDPELNAQFKLYNLFIRMNYHESEYTSGFLPGPHYHNWLCGDSLVAMNYYAYMNDPEKAIAGIYPQAQHEDGYVPDVPLWTEGKSWRDREAGSILSGLLFANAVATLVRFLPDEHRSRELFDQAVLAVRFVLRHYRDGNLPPGGNHAFDALDWPSGFESHPQCWSLILARRTLDLMGPAAEYFGEMALAEEYRAVGEDMRRQVMTRYYQADRGYLRIGIAAGGTCGVRPGDRELFEGGMIGWSTLMAVTWGTIRDRRQARRALDIVRKRLFTPYGMRYLDPGWKPSYTDSMNQTVRYGSTQNAGIWQTWYSTEYLVQGEVALGNVSQAWKDFGQLRQSCLLQRLTQRTGEERKRSFLATFEWVDDDLTFPVSCLPYMMTAVSHNQCLVETLVGLRVGLRELRFEPHLPETWKKVKISRLRLRQGEYRIVIYNGPAKRPRISCDGKRVEAVAITPGLHRVVVDCRRE